MSICYENMLKNSLANGNLLNAYFIFGNDAYLKKQYVDKIIDKTVDRNDIFNFVSFTNEADLQEIYDAVEQFPMMSEKKCVLITDYDFEHATKSDFEKLIDILSNVPTTCVVIFWCNNIEFEFKKKTLAQKIAAAVEKSGGMAVQIDHRTIAELKRMLEKGAEKRGCTFENGAAEYLIEMSSDDINLLTGELEKLCAYVGGGTINRDVIDKVSVKSYDASIYNLSKEIFAQNITGVMQLLDELFFLRVDATPILHSIFSTFIDAYRVYIGKTAGVPIPTVAKDFGYGKREFVLTKLPVGTKKLDEKRFRLCFNALVNADAALKSFSSNERTVLEELAVRLIYIISRGEDIAEN